jgi:hypothetical protein
MSGNNMKSCIACGSTIPEQAKICKECKNYQASWKNLLRFLASVVGVISLAAGVLTFVISSVPDVQKVIAWKDEIRFLTFATGKPIAIANIGDGDVFVTHVNISGSRPSGSRFSSTERIGEFIEAGKLITVDQDSATSGIGYKVVAATDPEEIDGLINRSELPSDTDACVEFRFAVPEDPGYITFREFLGERMIMFEADAYVRFFSIKKQAYIDQDVAMVGYLVIKDDDKCQK